MPSFAEYYPIQCLLEISRKHRDAVDPSRIRDGKVIGQDNWDNLAVSSVFAAISIEAALNDYLLCHCLFLELPALQQFFGGVMETFLRSRFDIKLGLLKKCWSRELPSDLLTKVGGVIRVRNRIAHQTGEFITAGDREDGRAALMNHRLTEAE
jgi:hypothetical protein